MNALLVAKFFLQGVPETAAVLFACFALAGYKIKARLLLPYAIFLALIVYLLRALPGFLGIHSIVGMILLTVMVHKVSKISLGKAFFIAVTVNFVLALVELLVLNILGVLFSYQLAYCPTEWDWLWLFNGWPQIIILFLFGYVVSKYLRPFYYQALKARWNNEQ